MPKVSPCLFRTFAAKPSSPAARKAIFLSQLPISAVAVALATAEDTDEAADGMALERLWMKRYGTDTGMSYAMKRCAAAYEAPKMN